MRLVARKVFGALWHDGGHKYIVTIDGVYSHTIWADNDADAITMAGWYN